MNDPKKKLYVFAGEPSADQNGKALAHVLNRYTHIEGVAGPKMRSEGVNGDIKMEDFCVMGFSDVLRNLPRLIRQFISIRNHILNEKPDGVLFIDSPALSLRMAKSLRSKGYKGKIIQYIAPSVWAWGPERAMTMSRSFDLLMTIYPFEKTYFDQTPLPVKYVGLPVKEQITFHHYQDDWKHHVSVPEGKPLIALFPGSRSGEIQRNLPQMLEAATKLKSEHSDLFFVISCANSATHMKITDILKQYKKLAKTVFLVPETYKYEMMRDSKCAIAKSGTVTLELALHHCPTVVVYQLTKLNHCYAKYILKTNLPHYCIVNIIMKKEVFPEITKEKVTGEGIYHRLKRLYTDEVVRQSCINSCREMDVSFGLSQCGAKAAEAVMSIL